MKIAILTQPLGHNYGGIMQAYALQKVLRGLGHDVTTIDRRSNKRNAVVRLALPLKPILYPLLGRRVARRLSSEQEQYVYSGMADFIETYIKRSEPIFGDLELKAHFKRQKYDLTVVGSDQVWRPKYSPSLYNFFVDFLSEGDTAIAYAASFGVDGWEFEESQTQKCRELIKKFNAVSVRESSAVGLCKEQLHVDAELVLDPTLLVPAEEYLRNFASASAGGKGGVLTYILDASDQKTRIANQVACRLGVNTFSAQPMKSLLDKSGTDLDDYKYPSVEEWVMSFYNSDFVVTDSFHGCVFAIIFNKPFIAVGNERRGMSRFESLLSIFGLSDRLMFGAEGADLVRDDIDWSSVNSKLTAYQEMSKRFLLEWV